MLEVIASPNGVTPNEDNHNGTFRHSLKAPIHRWFPYPVGFSPALVDDAIQETNVKDGAIFYDPFAGTATSLVAARLKGLEVHGLEAHPFIYSVGATKLRWDVGTDLARDAEELIRDAMHAARAATVVDGRTLPPLLVSCYSTAQLARLLAIRDHIRCSLDDGSALRDLAELGLAAIARSAASVSTKWPYIAPKRKRTGQIPDGADLFGKQLRRMVEDLSTVSARLDWPDARLVQADARESHPYLTNGSVDISVTSAPYLNNFDYADRTRLETYLMGHFCSWRDLTVNVRRHLVICSTPQFDGLRTTTEELLVPVKALDSALWREITGLVEKISEAKQACKGNKRFDLVAAGYFGDMARVLVETAPLFRSGARMMIVVGDSALFGVHVPTDELIGRLGVAAGFTGYSVRYLRSRGSKWLSVRRNDGVQLRESLVTLYA